MFKSVESAEKYRDFVVATYSPELNLVERLWLYIKQNTIKNKVFSTISKLEEVVCNFMKNLSSEVVKSVCSYNY